MKYKTTAYILCIFLGLFGAHKFYLNKRGMGMLYLFTFGFFGIGWIVDLFTLSSQVDIYNAFFTRMFGPNSHINSIEIGTIEEGVDPQTIVASQLSKFHKRQEAIILSQEKFNNQQFEALA